MAGSAYTPSTPWADEAAEIIEIEDVDLGERVHGTARRLERLLQSLRHSTTHTTLTLPR